MLSPGVIIGIVVGALVGIALLWVIFVDRKVAKKASQNSRATLEMAPISELPPTREWETPESERIQMGKLDDIVEGRIPISEYGAVLREAHGVLGHDKMQSWVDKHRDKLFPPDESNSVRGALGGG